VPVLRLTLRRAERRQDLQVENDHLVGAVRHLLQ
jgi:hypothetical protein